MEEHQRDVVAGDLAAPVDRRRELDPGVPGSSVSRPGRTIVQPSPEASSASSASALACR